MVYLLSEAECFFKKGTCQKQLPMLSLYQPVNITLNITQGDPMTQTTQIPRFLLAATASLDVDAQCTFTHLCPLELPVTGGEDIAGELNAQAKKAIVRIGTKDAHSPGSLWVDTDKTPQFTPIPGYENMDIRWRIHGVPGSAGFNLIPGLPKPSEYDFFVWKGIELDMHPYGACYHDLKNKMSTGLIEWLQVKGIEVVIVGGLATDYCVRQTVLQLREAKINVIVNKAACRGIWATTNEEEQMKEFEAKGAYIIENAEELKGIIV
jgi:nicotinamidase/pyrazinamidase